MSETQEKLEFAYGTIMRMEEKIEFLQSQLKAKSEEVERLKELDKKQAILNMVDKAWGPAYACDCGNREFDSFEKELERIIDTWLTTTKEG